MHIPWPCLDLSGLRRFCEPPLINKTLQAKTRPEESYLIEEVRKNGEDLIDQDMVMGYA